MKNRLHDKKAGIFILIALILISVAEVAFRHMFLRDMIATTANYAETLAVIGLALAILIFTLKGKDRLCYILYGAWIAYFVFDQVFELPGMLATMFTLFGETGGLDIAQIVAIFVRLLSMIGTIIIGIIVVEYMNDGTINNRAYNITSGATILFIIPSIITPLIYVFSGNGDSMYVLIAFNALYRIAMVFLFTFFAYDSAKKQLSKVDFSK